MKLIDFVGEALTGRGALPRYDDPFQAAINQLVSLAGSVAAAARLIGVHPDSLRRYRRGARRPKDGGRAIVAALRTAAIRPGLQRRIRTGEIGGSLSITGVFTVSGDTRTRTIHPGRYIPGNTMNRIVNEWKKGDDEKADRALYRAIDKYYVDGITFDTIVRADFV